MTNPSSHHTRRSVGRGATGTATTGRAWDVRVAFTGDDSCTSWPLGVADADTHSEGARVTAGGLELPAEHYTIDGSDITFTDPPFAGELVQVFVNRTTA